MATVPTPSPNLSSPAPWIFPSALNRSFIADFEAQWISRLGPDFVPNGTFKFGHGLHPDIISKAAWTLKDDERFDPSSSSNSLQQEFGNEDVVVMVDDIIQPTWSGGDEKIVGMACHYFHYCSTGSKPNMYQDNKDCVSGNFHRDGLVIGTLSPTFWEMELQFTYIDRNLASKAPEPQKFPSGTRIRIPRMNVSSFGSPDTAICMLTLDWDPSTYNSQHSVPFPIYLDARENGRTTDSSNSIIYDPWVFNASFPGGISYDDTGLDCEGGAPPEHYLVRTGICSRRKIFAPAAGHTETRNGTWIQPDNRSNSTSNGTRADPSPPGENSKREDFKERVITGATIGSIVGIFVLVMIVRSIRRSKKYRRDTHETTLSENSHDEENTSGSFVPAISQESDTYELETGSLQMPPPTYAEATKHSRTRD